MIDRTDAYKKAIIGDVRRMWVRAVIDIIDPDIVYGTIDAVPQEKYSNLNQLYDKNFDNASRNATLELNRWVLNGSFSVYPDTPDPNARYNVLGSEVCGEDGVFENPQYIEMRFSNVGVLQACSVYFSSDEVDGHPSDFTVEVKQGGTTYFTKKFENNDKPNVSLSGFTVYNPDAIRVTVTRWSIPCRRLRMVEIVPGVYEEWDGNSIAEFSLKHQGDVSCVSLPYGTCTIRMDNLDRRFEPRNKQGIFQSIEERQGISVSMGVSLPDGSVERKPVGVYYQYSGGWKTSDNDLTMEWELVDIIGLLADREFIPPDTLPTILKEWVSSVVAQLGVNFENNYTVDPNYAELAVTVRSKSDVTGLKCGDVLRYICMATGTWPRADSETGFLAVEPLWDEGSKITLDNLVYYPTIKANNDIAAIIFTLNDGNGTQYVVSGNSTASSETVSISNPFIKTENDALTAARLILSAYGGNRIEITGRGDPASEIGDVDTVWLDESNATTARRIQQDLSLTDGVLQNVSSVLLQADGSFLFQKKEVILSSGTWTAPSGVSQLRVILVGKGFDGEKGEDGTWDSAGVNGEDGHGGKVWSGTININDQQKFEVTIGVDTVFGSYSSADGDRYEYGYTDIASGDSFARTGVANPLPGSGDGGAGGVGGHKGETHQEKWTWNDAYGNSGTYYETKIDRYPGPGEDGSPGATGCVVVYWDKEAT